MSVDTLKSHRRRELREFLMSRRARVTPADAGLPDGGARRRTPGLRREEVAVLAGVGASWYQWLEQGRDISVSPQVLDSVGRVLRLSNAERRHLYLLAGLNPPEREVEPEAGHVRRVAAAHRHLDAVSGAHHGPVLQRRAVHDAAMTVLGMRPGKRWNCLIDFFTDPMYRSRARNWEHNARTVVAQFRALCSASPDDEGFQAVLAEARASSAEFTELWERRDIEDAGQIRKELDHPLVGLLCLESSVMQMPARPDLSIVLHTPLDEANTAAKLQWLASPEGRRGAMYPVAG